MKEYRLSEINMGEEEALAVADVIRSKWLSVGPRTAEFELQFAERMRAGHAIAVSSCTTALHLALLAAKIGPGDEVLVPSYTFVATANSVVYQGATPVFVDITGEDDLNLDVADLERKITPQTRAIIPVHMAGFPANMDQIMKLAEAHDLVVIEDACHAIGAGYEGPAGSPFKGRKAGTIGHLGCFSFFGNKNLVTGEGGMVVTNDEDLAARVRLARSHGMSKTSWDKAAGHAMDYDVVGLGFNYRSTELTAALGLIQLRKLDDANRKRAALVARYRDNLSSVADLAIPFANRLEDSAHHIFPVILPDMDMRAPFRLALKEAGVQTSVHYPPVHQFTFYRELASPEILRLPRTEDVSAREVTLPLHPLLELEDVDAICTIVGDALKSGADMTPLPEMAA